jgi:hypothetical protein
MSSRTDTDASNDGPNKRRRSLFWRHQQQQQQQQQQEKDTFREKTARSPFAPLLSPSSRDIVRRPGENGDFPNEQEDYDKQRHRSNVSKLRPWNDLEYPVHDTPPRAGRKKSLWDPKTPDVHSTKKGNNNVMTTPNRYYNSPGGFALQRILDGCMSPHYVSYRGGTPNRNGIRNTADVAFASGGEDGPPPFFDNTDPNNADVSRGSDATTSLAPDLDDWNECFLKMPHFLATTSSSDERDALEQLLHGDKEQCGNFSKLLRGEVGVWDWCLKSHVKFDCFPFNCIPGRPLGSGDQTCRHYLSKLELDFDKIDQMAMELFMNPMKSVQSIERHCKNNSGKASSSSSSSSLLSSPLDIRHKQDEEFVLAQWKAALMYWQHPAVHPFLVPNVTQSNVPPLMNYSSFVASSHESMGYASIRGVSNGSILGGGSGSGSGGVDSSSNGQYFTGTKFSASGQANASSSFIFRHGNHSISRMMNNSLFFKGATDSLFSSHRGTANKFVSGTMSQFGNGSGFLERSAMDETTRAMLQQRKCEWQECFRSLFFRWMRRLKELRRQPESNEHDSRDESFSSRCCFFSISSDKTVLFRPFYDVSNKSGCFQPMILVSSSTKQMRSCLRAMGVDIKIMCKDRDKEEMQYKEVTEEFVNEWIESKKKKNEVDENMNAAREELEALRKATVQGQTVGADISISMFKRTGQRDDVSKSNASFPPLLIFGHDDCMAFFELFTNTVGTLDVTLEDGAFNDVPLLISRFLGLTRHMTLQQLNSTTIRGQDDQIRGKNTPEHPLSFIELHGPILPCAVQDLINASAAHFSLHRKHLAVKSEKCSDVISNIVCDENVLGSHYFMMNLIDYGEFEIQDNMLMKGSNTYLGTSGSFGFNGLRPLYEHDPAAEDSHAGHEHEKTTSSVVWDINRPFSIAYKTKSNIPMYT